MLDVEELQTRGRFGDGVGRTLDNVHLQFFVRGPPATAVTGGMARMSTSETTVQTLARMESPLAKDGAG